MVFIYLYEEKLYLNGNVEENGKWEMECYIKILF